MLVVEERTIVPLRSPMADVSAAWVSAGVA
jgi:hypothetical protein